MIDIKENILEYLQMYQRNPLNFIPLILDLAIVLFLTYNLLKIVKDSRAWQLVKGITLLVVATWLSGLLKLNILNYILSAVMNWGVILLIIIFQPEIRRALEQLGTNKFTKLFGMDKDIVTRTKKDITSTGVAIDAEVSPQLLVNIFVPNTPLHDGAVIISDNKIAAAACMLPLAGDTDIARGLGTRHRAAIGISKESDSIVVVVSEETGKISVAKDGTLIADLRDDVLKKILISNIVTKRFPEKEKNNNDKFKKIKENFQKLKNKKTKDQV